MPSCLELRHTFGVDNSLRGAFVRNLRVEGQGLTWSKHAPAALSSHGRVRKGAARHGSVAGAVVESP